MSFLTVFQNIPTRQSTSPLESLFWGLSLPCTSALNRFLIAFQSALYSRSVLTMKLYEFLFGFIFVFTSHRFCKIQVHLNKVVLFIASVALVTCWTVYRKESYAWILLDILSFALR